MSERRGRVAGKVALVTGAASGIGRAGALTLAGEGAVVVCADVDAAGAEATAAAVGAAGGTASACTLDVTAEPAWRAAVDRLLQAHARLDVAVNSAGIAFSKPVVGMALEEWHRVLAVNLDGVFLGTKHAILAMRRHPEGGSIVNVSSAAGLKALPGASAYGASKAAVCLFSRAAALECRQQGNNIRVNTVCPGGVRTPIWRSMPFFQDLVARTGSEEAAFRAMEQAGQGRFAEPEEIALGILYLASDEARFVTATDLIIDNGYRA
jgi:NAD(P)-dependent dehydrogenase (short-subunit alcohol dehydrogenase family)